MSFWNRIINAFSGADKPSVHLQEAPHNASRYAFVDVEVGIKDRKIHDIGAIVSVSTMTYCIYQKNR